MLILLLCSGLANSSELDNLIQTSSAIVDQMNKGVMMVGAGLEYANHGEALSDGKAHQSAQITSAQLNAYNDALVSMSYYMPYGDVKQVLEAKAQEHLQLVDEAVDVFTGAVVQMTQAQQVVDGRNSSYS